MPRVDVALDATARTVAQVGRPENGVNQHVFDGERGSTNTEFLTARIARDRPAILERMKAGALCWGLGAYRPINPNYQ